MDAITPTPLLATGGPAAAANEASLSFHTRLGWWMILAGLGGFLVWAALAPLDQGVPVTGTVVVAGHRKAVQHQTGGTVERILVREGDTVRAGQVVVSMNNVQARANADITRSQLNAALAAEARLMAERDHKPLPAGTTTPRADSGGRDAGVAQRQLLETRRRSLQGELSAVDENVAGLSEVNEGLAMSRQAKEQQLRLLKEQLDGARALVQEGFYPRNRLLELEREQAQVRASLSEDVGNLGRNERQISELRVRRALRQEDFQKDVRTQLAALQQEIVGLQSRLRGLEHELANTEVRAPVDGIVADLNIFTEGGVVPAGHRLMDIVPVNEPLVVDAQVPVDAIDSVKVDMPVEIALAAFNQNTTPRVPGTVSRLSVDRTVDEKTGMTFYRMQADVTPQGSEMLRELKVRPGMPVEIFVRTGERSLLNYLLRPFTDKLHNALTEE